MENIIFKKGEKIKKIKDFPNYSITNYGRVLSYAKGYPVWLNPSTDKCNYKHVRLYNDDNIGYYDNGMKKAKLKKVHRLVGQHFLKQPKGKNEINHKDFNKANNHVDNLEWVNRLENLNWSWQHGRMKNVHTIGAEKNSIHVAVYYDDGRVYYFQSITHAYVSLNCTRAVITRCIESGGKSRKYGFRVKVLDESPKDIDGLPMHVTYVTPESLKDKLDAYYSRYYKRKYPVGKSK